MMLHWCSVDPVSTKEVNRNNAMYGIQHNRNPFIDHPEYAYEIWGSPVGTGDDSVLSHQLAVYPNPATDLCTIAFPEGISAGDLKLAFMSVSGIKVNPSCSTEGNVMEVNIRMLPKGIYFLMATGQAEVYRAKVVKE
jgi:hypothetical protein